MSDAQIMIQPIANVAKAQERIKNFLHVTPILKSEILNQMLGHNIYFKVESLQKTGAFKVRGVLNHLLALKDTTEYPSKIVGYSTGNHGIGLAWAAQQLSLQARIYLPHDTSPVKQRAASFYGAEVIYTESRLEAEQRAYEDGKSGFYYLHPSDSDTTIAGAGTLCYEALQQIQAPIDAIFASIGGGGLLSGTLLAKDALSPQSLLFGVEPAIANDAYLSLQQGKIFRFNTSPNTIADGLRTLGISKRTFAHLQRLDKLFLVSEEKILYWTAWLLHLLKVACEPSCAMNMAAVCEWLKQAEVKMSGKKNILVLISGGNIDPVLYRKLWQEDYLLNAPTLE